MIAGGNWWRANEIVIRHLIRQTATSYRCRDRALRKYHRSFSKPRDGVTKEATMIYFARKHDCETCALKSKCCPNAPARKIARSIHEAARDRARAIAKTEAYAISRRQRKKVRCSSLT
jgi:hypothetical protein